ncbi:hypothetical protein NEUTE1DRAFT_120770 [Neurospora tetrasperma FGSC 2508]|uniref:Uncharacterized protein n=1 Tax=Neurospora tetrasperma (strain FGSC 2508 / ATCC MYA-4615 / P0657) TaxID=510951 RepID=F8MHT1_NEUT8|nr:uncharacterized protein NEUTE1DRAFT_120770 [Neurospora tetrasperma FGSC 2508]EGO58840.1 hypothetical protein NEUTE1DRAFT_120770 [Neurospora tetrasperma FGSC 2508]
MSVDKAIKLTRSNDQSITVSSGTDTFTIAFFEVPRVSDNAVRRFQRVRKPRTDVNETIKNSPGPHNFPFTIYGSPTEDNAKDKKKQKEGSRSHFLAIKDDKAFAIRMIGDCNESAFKVKVRVGGVNVLQHTTHGRKSQDYFVVSGQEWVWGKQVCWNTARQFRVFPRGREKLSFRYQLRKNNIKKEVEIEITSRRLDQPTGSCSYLPPPPSGMTLDGPGLSATYIPELPCYHTGPSTPYNHGMVPHASLLTASHELDSEDYLADEDFLDYIHVGELHHRTYHSSGRRRTPLIHMSGPPSPADPTDVVIPLSSNDSPSSSQPQHISQTSTFDDTDSSDSMSAGFRPRSTWLEMFGNGPIPPEAPLHTPTEPGHYELVLRPPSPVESLKSNPSSPVEVDTFKEASELPPLVSGTPVYEQESVTVAAPQPASDQESIHSDREEDMIPHQMVVGAGGLIEQLVYLDRHPKWIDDDTVTLKFKIVGDPQHLPKHLQNLEEPAETAVGGIRIRGTGPGGNYREVPNPPRRTFRALAPVVTDPDGLRRDIRSPMEMDLSDDENGESPESPIDSGEGSMGERDEGGRETDDGGEEGDARGFRELVEEAQTQPRGFKNKIRMKKKMREQRKRGGVRIMAEKREEPKSERSSRWRRFVDALRRVLTLAR